MPQHKAIMQCEKIANGKDFFVQQHGGGPQGHTVCGVFLDELTPTDRVVTHNHRYGAVCYVPKIDR